MMGGLAIGGKINDLTHEQTKSKRKNKRKKGKPFCIFFENRFRSGGVENERQMANNVNCEEMRFVIRNLVMLKILPGNGARNSF